MSLYCKWTIHHETSTWNITSNSKAEPSVRTVSEIQCPSIHAFKFSHIAQIYDKPPIFSLYSSIFISQYFLSCEMHFFCFFWGGDKSHMIQHCNLYRLRYTRCSYLVVSQSTRFLSVLSSFSGSSGGRFQSMPCRTCQRKRCPVRTNSDYYFVLGSSSFVQPVVNRPCLQNDSAYTGWITRCSSAIFTFQFH